MLDAVDEQHRHPGQGETPELLDSQVAGEQNCGEEVDAAHHRLVGKRPVDLAVTGQEPGGQLDQGV